MDTFSVDTTSSLTNAGAFGGSAQEDSDHSTPIDVREILRQLCSEQWDIHAKDVEASHRWLESFMAGVEEAVSGKGKRPAVAELMKTPGRKRVLPLSNNSTRKDPFATVLFPAPANPSASVHRVSPSKTNNENAASTPRSLSRDVFSPSATTTGLRGVASPRSPVKGGLRKSPTKLNIAETAAEIEKIINVEAELPVVSDTVAIDGASEEIGAAMIAVTTSDAILPASGEVVEEVVEEQKVEALAPLSGDDKCELSMIGEEEEDNDDQTGSVRKSPLRTVALPSSTRASLDSPRTSTSTASHPFVDAREEQKTSYTLPLNDDSSAPRPAPPANSTTRTPGNASTASIEPSTTGTSTCFGTQSQSAKTGHQSSSPPSSLFASTRLPSNLGASTSLAALSTGAPTGSFAGVTRPSGASVGGRLNFVGLPSLRDREGLSAASHGPGGMLNRAGSLGGVSQNAFRPTLSSNAPTLKRKSITGNEEANKIGRVNDTTSGEELRSRASQGGLQLGRSERLESLKSKLHSMGGGRLPPSPVAAAASTRNTLGGAIHNSIPLISAPLPPAPFDSPRLVAHAAAALSPLSKLVRQNSVNELVSSFEKNPDDHLPSPTKLPSPVKASVNHFNHLAPVLSPRSPKRAPTSSLARAISPSPLSPTRMTLRSPKIASPAPLPLSPRHGKQSQRIFEQAAIAQTASTTPKGSPTKPAVVERDEARSILQQMELADEDDTEEIVVPASTATTNLQQLANAHPLAADAEEDLTALLPSLPARLEVNSPEDDLSMNGDGGLVVERDRGGLAGEFEIRLVDDAEVEEEIVSAVKTVVVKASPVKITLPGSLPVEDGDGSFELIQPFFNRSNDAGLGSKTITKKTSMASINSEGSSQNGTSSFLSEIGKKGKVEVKSIQLAAAAAKKDAQERERKADLKEKNEKRRAFAIQKKADEDQRKVEEERNVERKIREEAAAQLAAASLKSKLVRQKSKLDMSEPEPTKKRKVEVAEVKRPETKKARDPSSRPGSAQANYSNATASSSRAPVTSANLLKNSGNASSSHASGSMVGVKYMNDPARTTAPLNVSKGASSNPFAPKVSSAQHHPVASTSSHRPPPPRPAPRVVPVEVEEDIVLPDINSEYSDSDDEGHEAKTKALPAWAQSPALADALYRQQYVNPDDVFGPIPALEMGEIFRSKSTRISKRTSSANWEGVDALTEAEQTRYNRVMGFTALPPSNLR